MSDVLDIQSQCCSEFEDESENVICVIKELSKTRKRSGFLRNGNSELKNIKEFDKLQSQAISNETDVQAQGSVEGWVLFVTGIHEEASEDDVKDLFQEYGVIKNLILNLDRRTGYIKGYALLEFAKYDEAYNAKQNLDESQLLGQTIHVNWTFVKTAHMVYQFPKQRTARKSYRYCYQ